MVLGQLLGRGRRPAVLRMLAYVTHLLKGERDLTDLAASQKPWLFHEVLLAGWGCPIGELFDLEKLADHCKKMNRWSFFVSSEVCNVPGGVAR